MKICIDPGHGNKNRGDRYDPGAVADGVTEAEIVMDWANELRAVLIREGHKVVRTRIDDNDPCPLNRRAKIARDYGCDVMISLHCNAANGRASGTETFYRGSGVKAATFPEAKVREALARKVNNAVVQTLGTKDRGVKQEHQTQHGILAVMDFQPCVLLEIGFIDNAGDRLKMLDPALRRKACEALALVLTAS